MNFNTKIGYSQFFYFNIFTCYITYFMPVAFIGLTFSYNFSIFLEVLMLIDVDV